MAYGKISALQKFEPTDYQGLVTENNLGQMGMLSPILVNKTIDNIYEVNVGLDLDRFMDQFPTLELDDDLPFEWSLNSQSQFKNTPLIAFYDSTLSSQPASPGIGNTDVWFEFPDKLFSEIDVFAPADYGKETYQWQIKEWRPSGSNHLYRASLMTGDSNLFQPATELVAGKRFVKMFSPVEQTLSQRGSNSVTHSSPFRMQNRLSMIRKEFMVPGNMIDKKANNPIAFPFVDASGKVQATWLGKLDYDYMVEFKRQKAMLGLYAKANKNSQGAYIQKGESGYEIKMGSGIYEQISPSNVHYYSSFNIDVLSDILMTLSVGKLPQDRRKFVLGTGEYGMRAFHRSVETKSVAYGPNRIEMRFSGSMDDLKYGGQFTAFGFINGIEVTLMYIPFLDDPSLCATQHPDGGLLSSYEFLILDFGTQQGNPNIQKVTLKGGKGEMNRYIPGLRDPFTPNSSGTHGAMTVSKVDGYEIIKAYIGGTKIHNPMRCARFIPNLV